MFCVQNPFGICIGPGSSDTSRTSRYNMGISGSLTTIFRNIHTVGAPSAERHETTLEPPASTEQPPSMWEPPAAEWRKEMTQNVYQESWILSFLLKDNSCT